MKEAIKRLIEVQKELKAPKGQYNSFAKFKYRSAEDILEAVKPLLAERNLLLTLSDSVDQIGDRYYMVATATVIDAETGEIVTTNTAYAQEPDSQKGLTKSQCSGVSSSYARKYCLNGLLIIDDTKDADTDEFHRQTHKRPAESTLKAKLKMAKLEDEQDKVLERYDAKKFSDLTDEQANELEDLLDTQIKLLQKKADNEKSKSA